MDVLWLNNWYMPAWDTSKPAMWDAGTGRLPAYASISIQGCSGLALEVEKCSKLCEDGLVTEAVDALGLLVQRQCRVPRNLFYRLLKTCIAHKDMAMGRRVHVLTVKSGYEGNAFLATHLIGLYAADGKVEDAMRVFSEVPSPSAHNWASIIFAYARHGEPKQAIELYRQMLDSTVEPDNRIFVGVLKACVRAGDLGVGKIVHAHIRASAVKPDKFLQTCLIDMYAKCGSLEDAQREFDRVPQKDVVTWTAMIAGYAQKGMGQEALGLYNSMKQEGITHPSSGTFSYLLQACAGLGAPALQQGKQAHLHIQELGLQNDLVVGNGLVNMYSKCGSLENAHKVFNELCTKDVVTWNTMIAGYAQQGLGQEALSLYSDMQQEATTPPDSVTFVTLCQACAALGVSALHQGKELHAQIEQLGLHAEVVVGASLVNMYAKCDSLEDARRVFNSLPTKNVVAWNAMIGGYAQKGMGQEALSLYTSMQHDSITLPTSVTFVCLLQACAGLGRTALHQGKQLHAEIEQLGVQGDVVVGASLVNMYAKCGSLEDAQKVFDKLTNKDLVTWTALIAGYAQQGMGQEALSLYVNMQQKGNLPPDSVTFVCLLQACASVGATALHQGKHLHAEIEHWGIQTDVVLGASLVNMYVNCGSLEDAQRVFDRLPNKDVMTWTAMIAGYTQQGMGQEALGLYTSMRQAGIIQPSSVTFVCLLQACAGEGVTALHEGKRLHAHIDQLGLQADVVVGTSLVDMYAKCGSLADARRVFDRLSQKDAVTWTAMIAGYAHHGMGEEALGLYTSMQQEGISQPSRVTFLCLLQACAALGVAALDQGKLLHSQIRKLREADVVVGNSLVNMYAKCGDLQNAKTVFDGLPQKNVGTWNAMITAYAQQGLCQEALNLYGSMKQEGVTQPDSITFVCILQACSSIGVGALHHGKELHVLIEEQGLQYDVALGNSLVNLYAKCGNLDDAHKVFDRLAYRDVVAWTAMIAGYAGQGMCQEALGLYSSMQQEGITAPNGVTFLCLLQACATLGTLPLGKQLHAQIEDQGLQTDILVGPSLVTMYAKCGSMVDAQQVFDSLPEQGIVAWNALIAGYSRQGDSEIVFDLVRRMRHDGIEPDGITSLSVLTVCSHVGLVDKGRQYFESMCTENGISPNIEHYTCMVDLLGRAGQLDEALVVSNTMPFQPDGVVWLTLLGACLKWGNVEVGRQAFEFAVRLDEKDAAAYVLMSNIYAGAEMWEAANEMQGRRRSLGAWKQPGQSCWTDMNGVVHTFVVGESGGMHIHKG